MSEHTSKRDRKSIDGISDKLKMYVSNNSSRCNSGDGVKSKNSIDISLTSCFQLNFNTYIVQSQGSKSLKSRKSVDQTNFVAENKNPISIVTSKHETTHRNISTIN